MNNSNYYPTCPMGYKIRTCLTKDHSGRYWLTGKENYPAVVRQWLCIDCHPLAATDTPEMMTYDDETGNCESVAKRAA